MLFPTFEFGLFFLIVFAISWELKGDPRGRKLFLLGASYVFYGWWDWRFTALLATSSAINYIAGRIVGGSGSPALRKTAVTIAVALNLAILGFFKYYGFFIEQLDVVLHTLGWERDLPFLEIILPVGISFFTFQGISYVVDVYRKHVPAARSALDVFLYISFFPQLVAGPIVRAATFMPQLDGTPPLSRGMVSLGVVLISVGLFKKVVIANYLATDLVDTVFFDPTVFGGLDLLIGVYGYAIQIYCDFSAYSDIAIGVAALLGYKFNWNFNQPYRAASLQEFWRRWHISLSTWLRDYLYIPLGGSHGSRFGTYRNLFVTMFLGGLWHGAAWTFVFWGTFHGTALAIERRLSEWWTRRYRRPGLLRRAVGKVTAVFVTFHLVCFAWIFFRAENFELAWAYVIGLTDFSQPVLITSPFLVGLIGLSFLSHFLPESLVERTALALQNVPGLLLGLVLGAAILIVEAFGPEGVAPFIYFQF